MRYKMRGNSTLLKETSNPTAVKNLSNILHLRVFVIILKIGASVVIPSPSTSRSQ